MGEGKEIGRELVSVIVVCYNEIPHKIQTTLDSIASQDYPEVEIIVIDGGSSEETLGPFDAFRTQIGYFVSEPDEGIFDAMNKGVSRAKGEWVTFMNIGDSFCAPNSLDNLLRYYSESYDVLYGDPIKGKSKVTKSPRCLNRYVFYSQGICHQALISRYSMFERMGAFDTKYKVGGDVDWIYRVYKGGARFKYVPIPICNYEGGGASSDYRLCSAEISRFRRENFSPLERFSFGITLLVMRISKRLIKFDFTIPVVFKDYYREILRRHH
jgi:glycosyltransferase involved in cell wall biosynthesis